MAQHRLLIYKNLQGKVVVTGQDADLACQNSKKGFPVATVYKPSSALSKASMEAAFALIEGKEVETNSVMDNGYRDVPTIALESFAVDKDNIDDTIIADGYQTKRRSVQRIIGCSRLCPKAFSDTALGPACFIKTRL